MRTEEFEKLCNELGTFPTPSMRKFIDHAIALRHEVINGIDYRDAWDQEWPIVGYEPYAEDEDDEYIAIQAWRKKH